LKKERRGAPRAVSDFRSFSDLNRENRSKDFQTPFPLAAASAARCRACADGQRLDRGNGGIDDPPKYGLACRQVQLQQVVNTNDKKRFEFSEDGAHIRARQGHSVTIDLGLAPMDPPAFLFHCTATRFVPPILKAGLKPMRRHHVHLSADRLTATRSVAATASWASSK